MPTPKSTNQPSVTSEKMVIPEALHCLFEKPPVLATENREDYQALLTRITAALRPQSDFEWIWMKDYVDLTWESRRYKIAKTLFLESAIEDAILTDTLSFSGGKYGFLPPGWRRRVDGHKEVRAFLESCGMDVDDIMASALVKEAERLERVEAMLASAEHRRNAAIREIEHHRDLAKRVREFEDKPIDAEFSEAPSLPAPEKKAA